VTLPIRRVIALAALALAVLAGPDRAGAEEAVQTLRQARLVATVAGQAQPPREIAIEQVGIVRRRRYFGHLETPRRDDRPKIRALATFGGECFGFNEFAGNKTHDDPAARP